MYFLFCDPFFQSFLTFITLHKKKMASLFPQNNDLIQTAIDFNQENSCLGKEDIKHFVPDHEIYPSSAKATFTSPPFVVNANFYVPQFHEKRQEQQEQNLRAQYPLMNSSLVSNSVSNMDDLFNQMRYGLENKITPAVREAVANLQPQVNLNTEALMGNVQEMIEEEIPRLIEGVIQNYVPQKKEFEQHNYPIMDIENPSAECVDFVAKLTGGSERIAAEERFQRQLAQMAEEIKNQAHPEETKIKALEDKVQSMHNLLLEMSGRQPPPPQAPASIESDLQEEEKAAETLSRAFQMMKPAFIEQLTHLRIGQEALAKTHSQMPAIETSVVPLSLPIAEKFESVNEAEIKRLNEELVSLRAERADFIAKDELIKTIKSLQVPFTEVDAERITSSVNIEEALSNHLKEKAQLAVQNIDVADLMKVLNNKISEQILADTEMNNLISMQKKNAFHFAQIKALIQDENKEYATAIVSLQDKHQAVQQIMKERTSNLDELMNFLGKIQIRKENIAQILDEERDEEKKPEITSPEILSSVPDEERISILGSSLEKVNAQASDLTSLLKGQVGAITTEINGVKEKVDLVSSLVSSAASKLRSLSFPSALPMEIPHPTASVTSQGLERSLVPSINEIKSTIQAIPTGMTSAIERGVERSLAELNSNVIPSASKAVENAYIGPLSALKEEMSKMPHQISEEMSVATKGEIEVFKQMMDLENKSLNNKLTEKSQEIFNCFLKIHSAAVSLGPQLQEALTKNVTSQFLAFNSLARKEELKISKALVPLITSHLDKLNEVETRLSSILDPTSAIGATNQFLLAEMRSINKRAIDISMSEDIIKTFQSQLKATQSTSESYLAAATALATDISNVKKTGFTLDEATIERIIKPYTDFMTKQTEIMSRDQVSLRDITSKTDALQETNSRLLPTITNGFGALEAVLNSQPKWYVEQVQNALKEYTDSTARQISAANTSLDSGIKSQFGFLGSQLSTLQSAQQTEFSNQQEFFQNLVTGYHMAVQEMERQNKERADTLQSSVSSFLDKDRMFSDKVSSLLESNQTLVSAVKDKFIPALSNLVDSNKSLHSSVTSLFDPLKANTEELKKIQSANEIFLSSLNKYFNYENERAEENRNMQAQHTHQYQEIMQTLQNQQFQANPKRVPASTGMKPKTSQDYAASIAKEFYGPPQANTEKSKLVMRPSRSSNNVPVTQPLGPADVQSQPVGSMEPDAQPVGPIAQPMEPVGPVAQPMEPVAQPVRPVAQPMGPVAQPTQIEVFSQPVSQPVPQQTAPSMDVEEALVPFAPSAAHSKPSILQILEEQLKESQPIDINVMPDVHDFLENTNLSPNNNNQEMIKHSLAPFLDAVNNLQSNVNGKIQQVIQVLSQYLEGMRKEIVVSKAEANQTIVHHVNQAALSIKEEGNKLKEQMKLSIEAYKQMMPESKKQELLFESIKESLNKKIDVIGDLPRANSSSHFNLRFGSNQVGYVSFLKGVLQASEGDMMKADTLGIRFQTLGYLEKREEATRKQLADIMANEAAYQTAIRDEIPNPDDAPILLDTFKQALAQDIQFYSDRKEEWNEIQDKEIAKLVGHNASSSLLNSVFDVATFYKDKLFELERSDDPTARAQIAKLFEIEKSFSSNPLKEEDRRGIFFHVPPTAMDEETKHFARTEFELGTVLQHIQDKVHPDFDPDFDEEQTEVAQKFQSQLENSFIFKLRQRFRQREEFKRMNEASKRVLELEKTLQNSSSSSPETLVSLNQAKNQFLSLLQQNKDLNLTQKIQRAQAVGAFYDPNYEKATVNEKLKNLFVEYQGPDLSEEDKKIKSLLSDPSEFNIAYLPSLFRSIQQNAPYDEHQSGLTEKLSPREMFIRQVEATMRRQHFTAEDIRQVAKKMGTTTDLQIGAPILQELEKRTGPSITNETNEEKTAPGQVIPSGLTPQEVEYWDWVSKLKAYEKADFEIWYQNLSPVDKAKYDRRFNAYRQYLPQITEKLIKKHGDQGKVREELERFRTQLTSDKKEEVDQALEDEANKYRPVVSTDPQMQSLETYGNFFDDDDQLGIDESLIPQLAIENEDITMANNLKVIQNMLLEQFKSNMDKQLPPQVQRQKNEELVSNLFSLCQKHIENSLSKSIFKKQMMKKFNVRTTKDIFKALNTLPEGELIDVIQETEATASAEAAKQMERVRTQIQNYMKETYQNENALLRFMSKFCSQSETIYAALDPDRFSISPFDPSNPLFTIGTEREVASATSDEYKDQTRKRKRQMVEATSGQGALNNRKKESKSEEISLASAKGTYHPFFSTKEWNFSNFKEIIWKLKRDFATTRGNLSPQMLHLQEIAFNACSPTYFKLLKQLLMYHAAKFCFSVYQKATVEEKKKLIPYHQCSSYSEMLLIFYRQRFQNSKFGRRAISDFFCNIQLYNLFDFIESVMN